jgi:hypothetical protein
MLLSAAAKVTPEVALEETGAALLPPPPPPPYELRSIARKSRGLSALEHQGHDNEQREGAADPWQVLGDA